MSDIDHRQSVRLCWKNEQPYNSMGEGWIQDFSDGEGAEGVPNLEG